MVFVKIILLLLFVSVVFQISIYTWLRIGRRIEYSWFKKSEIEGLIYYYYYL